MTHIDEFFTSKYYNRDSGSPFLWKYVLIICKSDLSFVRFQSDNYKLALVNQRFATKRAVIICILNLLTNSETKINQNVWMIAIRGSFESKAKMVWFLGVKFKDKNVIITKIVYMQYLSHKQS